MNLNINYDAARQTGQSVITQADEFKSLLDQIKNTNNELKTYWQGDDATKYSGAVDEQAEQMQKLETTIREIGEFLIKAANAYQEAMERNRDAIRG